MAASMAFLALYPVAPLMAPVVAALAAKMAAGMRKGKMPPRCRLGVGYVP